MRLTAGALASIPSPSSGAIHLGPLQLRAYGLMIALGVLAAVWLTSRRALARRLATKDDVSAIAVWGVIGGVVGARLYHVITDWQRFSDDPVQILFVWKGGLGIWGGIAGGVLTGAWAARRRGVPVVPMLDVVAPSLALAQAIGRWGNWWNQELFGRPTELPWALEIDPSRRPPGFEAFATFHPTFLYESLWNLAICATLLLVDARRPVRPPRLFAGYVATYTFGRFFIERIRIDEANQILGLRVNEWVSAIVFVAAVAYLVATRHGAVEPVAADLVPAGGGSVTGEAEAREGVGDGGEDGDGGGSDGGDGGDGGGGDGGG